MSSYCSVMHGLPFQGLLIFFLCKRKKTQQNSNFNAFFFLSFFFFPSVLKCSCKDQDHLQVLYFMPPRLHFFNDACNNNEIPSFPHRNEQQKQSSLFEYLKGIPAVSWHHHQQMMHTRCFSQPLADQFV